MTQPIDAHLPYMKAHILKIHTNVHTHNTYTYKLTCKHADGNNYKLRFLRNFF